MVEATVSLVATGHDDAGEIEQRAFDLHFDFIDQQAAARQDVAALSAGAGDEIAGCRGANLEGKGASRTDCLLDVCPDSI